MAVAGPSRLPDLEPGGCAGTGCAGFTTASALQRKRGGCDDEVEASTTVSASLSMTQLDQPSHAVQCLCFDLLLMRIQPCAGSIRIFIHIRRPTTYAHIVGRIVGVEEKETKVVWLVDDGTAVIAVHYTHNSRPVPMRKKQLSHDTVEERKTTGVPSQYFRHSSPARAQRHASVVNAEKFSQSISHIEVCSLVSVVGRIDVRYGQEKVLLVDRVLPEHGAEDESKYRSEREAYIAVVEDVNEEAKHALLAVSSAEAEYRSVIRIDASIEQAAATLLSKAPTQQPKRPAAFDLGTTPRLLLQSLNGRSKPDIGCPERGKVRDHKEAPPTVEGQCPISGTSSQKPRRLRDFRKLSDHHLSEQLLRVYVQKHIYDHCNAASSMASMEAPFPPPFTVAYLTRVRNLCGLAKRIVRYEREKQRLRRIRSGKLAKSSSGYAFSAEGEDEKVSRLFDSVIRAISLDGMVVLADRAVPIQAPFNGTKPTVDILQVHDPDGLLRWVEDTGKEDESRPPEIPAADDSMMKWRGGGRRAEQVQEAYQVVSPTLLAPHVLGFIGLGPAQVKSEPDGRPKRLGTGVHARRTNNTSSPAMKTPGDRMITKKLEEAVPADIVESLRRADDRWQHIQTDAVVDCLRFLLARSQDGATPAR